MMIIIISPCTFTPFIILSWPSTLVSSSISLIGPSSLISLTSLITPSSLLLTSPSSLTTLASLVTPSTLVIPTALLLLLLLLLTTPFSLSTDVYLLTTPTALLLLATPSSLIIVSKLWIKIIIPTTGNIAHSIPWCTANCLFVCPVNIRVSCKDCSLLLSS